jgi:hypothetical protein
MAADGYYLFAAGGSRNIHADYPVHSLTCSRDNWKGEVGGLRHSD